VERLTNGCVKPCCVLGLGARGRTHPVQYPHYLCRPVCIIITCINLHFVVSIHSSFNVKHIVVFIDLVCVCVYLLYNLFKVSSLNDGKSGFMHGRLINVKHDGARCVMVKVRGRDTKEQNRVKF